MKSKARILIIFAMFFLLLYVHDHPYDAKEKLGEMAGTTQGMIEQSIQENVTEENILKWADILKEKGIQFNDLFGRIFDNTMEQVGYEGN